MAEILRNHDLHELMIHELESLELRDPGSREKLLSSSEEVLGLILDSRNIFDFLTRLAKYGDAEIKDYDFAVDFFNAKSRRNLKLKSDRLAKTRSKTQEILDRDKK